MKVSEIRQVFLDYFKNNGHTVVPSASLIPKQDPSLLFVNAGMVPFKEDFLAICKPRYSAAASAQRCLRVGGKHNDLDNVGKTARHHTLFEMLGNFSFGAYDKRQAIRYAWVFLTEVVNLPLDRLWVTVFHEDTESRDLWINDIGLEPERVIGCGEKDNFWQMGAHGPCGPCTEIFYDHGPEVAGGLPGSVDEDGDRYVEVWNIVFMQFNRIESGDLLPLPMPCVDTGMGLERIAAVMQGVHSNYEIDSFQAIINAYREVAGKSVNRVASQVIADHMRSICWLIHDGVLPSNEKRGYVLRRIIRRALRFAYVDGVALPVLYRLVPVVVSLYQDDTDFVASQEKMTQVLRAEEQAFSRTIAQGIHLFDKAVSVLTGRLIPGDTAFKLYDTYGFPLDLVEDLAEEKGLAVDVPGFEVCMRAQKDRSRQNQQFSQTAAMDWLPEQTTEFVGYDEHASDAQLLCIYAGDSKKEVCTEGEAILVFDQSPFYAESGGQVGDIGLITTDHGVVFRVRDTQKRAGHILHRGVLEHGRLSVGDRMRLTVDENRLLIRKNHSATHLMHEALVSILGEHVSQKGSLVTADRLRFDFSHHQGLTPEEICQVERFVNRLIESNFPVSTAIMPLDDAKSQGVKALFDEKYEENVRVLTMGPSKELCGGTHVERTGDIGLFLIVEQTAVSQGVRRIEAVTGEAALAHSQKCRAQLQDVVQLVQSSVESVSDKVKKLLDTQKQLQKKLERMQAETMRQRVLANIDTVEMMASIRVVLLDFAEGDAKQLRLLTDHCLQTGHVDVVVFLLAQNDKILLSVGVGNAMLERIDAVMIFRSLGEQLGFKGGGKHGFAQGSLALGSESTLSRVKQQTHRQLQAVLTKVK